MKTSLGIWALRRTTARSVPGGSRAANGYSTEPVADKVHRAVEGLGDIIDGYEFHYPAELSPENLDHARAALAGHDIYCLVSGLHLDPRFSRGGLANPTASLRAEARRSICEAAEFAGSLGANLIVWLGIEGDAIGGAREAWPQVIEGIGRAAEICSGHGTRLLLDHRSAEPEPRILRLNMGMCLHVIQRLRVQGIGNVGVSLDWRHLVMNGERLSDYATLLASEGLLGHQHADPGGGHFDEDDVVGVAAFMELLELALELRRCGYGSRGERLGYEFDLNPRREDQIATMRRIVRRWRFIESVAAKVDARALRETRHVDDPRQAYEIVHAALAG